MMWRNVNARVDAGRAGPFKDCPWLVDGGLQPGDLWPLHGQRVPARAAAGRTHARSAPAALFRPLGLTPAYTLKNPASMQRHGRSGRRMAGDGYVVRPGCEGAGVGGHTSSFTAGQTGRGVNSPGGVRGTLSPRHSVAPAVSQPRPLVSCAGSFRAADVPCARRFTAARMPAPHGPQRPQRLPAEAHALRPRPPGTLCATGRRAAKTSPPRGAGKPAPAIRRPSRQSWRPVRSRHPLHPLQYWWW